MGKFITIREEFESETGAHTFADQQYIEWLEKLVERQRQVKNCSIPLVSNNEVALRAFLQKFVNDCEMGDAHEPLHLEEAKSLL